MTNTLYKVQCINVINNNLTCHTDLCMCVLIPTFVVIAVCFDCRLCSVQDKLPRGDLCHVCTCLDFPKHARHRYTRDVVVMSMMSPSVWEGRDKKLFFNRNGIKSLEHCIIMFGNIVCNINVIIYIHILSPGY